MMKGWHTGLGDKHCIWMVSVDFVIGQRIKESGRRTCVCMYLHLYAHMCAFRVFLGPIWPLRLFLLSWLEMLPKCLVVEGVELYLADYSHIHLKSLGRKLGSVLRRKPFINAREDSLAWGKFLYKQILALAFFSQLRFLISLHSIPDATETAGQTYFFVYITTYYYYFFFFYSETSHGERLSPVSPQESQNNRGEGMREVGWWKAGGGVPQTVRHQQAAWALSRQGVLTMVVGEHQ